MTHPNTEGLAAAVVRYQCCAACGAWQPLTRLACRACGGADLHWKDASGSATVFAVTEVSRAPTDAFRELAPYTLVLATLDEGPRVMAHAAPGVRIGDRVRASFMPFGDGTLLRFL
ncbi:Zn-ribbon domain-containing OB-fold protein [Cupriavidus plantarum]|uniref:Zn-ribbon domain-containing OB-fold protein n=1 Tax=Cupriavidus plantarum TaxID=942865 RepID=UPI00339D7C0C